MRRARWLVICALAAASLAAMGFIVCSPSSSKPVEAATSFIQLAPIVDSQLDGFAQGTPISPPVVFYDNTLSFDYQGGRLSVSTCPEGTCTIVADDALTLTVTRPDATQAFRDFPFYTIDWPPEDVTSMFQTGNNTIRVQLSDRMGPRYGSPRPFYLVTCAVTATLTVLNTNDGGPGSLRQTIADACPGDIIDFDSSLAGQTITLTGALHIDKSVEIRGPSAGIAISANHTGRVLEVGGLVPLSVKISHVTMQDGGRPDLGGQPGAGVYSNVVQAVTLELTDVALINNTYEGAIAVFNNTNLILRRVRINGNNAYDPAQNAVNPWGAALTAGDGTVTLEDVDISGNGKGSGIIQLGGTLQGTNVTISDNQSFGILNYQTGNATLTNATISGNSFGVHNLGAMNLTNVTVSGNAYGGLVNWPACCLGSPPPEVVLNLKNTIVADQPFGSDCQGIAPIISLGYNLDSDGSCGLTAAGDLPNTNPMLAALALNPPGSTETQALEPGSPAIDHIPVATNGCGTTITTDQRGVARPQGAACDIGAYELAQGVGGIAGAPDVAGRPLESAGSSGTNAGMLAGVITGASAGVLVLGGAAWYGRRRWGR